MFAIRCKHIVSGNSLRDLDYVTDCTALLVSVDDNSYLLCTFYYAYIRWKLNGKVMPFWKFPFWNYWMCFDEVWYLVLLCWFCHIYFCFDEVWYLVLLCWFCHIYFVLVKSGTWYYCVGFVTFILFWWSLVLGTIVLVLSHLFCYGEVWYLVLLCWFCHICFVLTHTLHEDYSDFCVFSEMY
jgi:hypothetical protein